MNITNKLDGKLQPENRSGWGVRYPLGRFNNIFKVLGIGP